MAVARANGKICYLEIPAKDVAQSADFYQRVFGWSIRKRGDGTTAFDDTTGQVSGSWVIGRAPATTPGMLFYIMVENVAAVLDTVVANRGAIAEPVSAKGQATIAKFRDPAGNVIGLYQESS